MSGNAFPPRPHLTTPRLTLNALTPADCGDYAALCRDARRNRWWGYDYREEQPHPPEEWFLQASEEDYAAGRELGLAVRLRGRCIGEVVFTHFDGHGTAELGCRIAAAYAGHGYGLCRRSGVGPEGLGSAAGDGQMLPGESSLPAYAGRLYGPHR